MPPTTSPAAYFFGCWITFGLPEWPLNSWLAWGFSWNCFTASGTLWGVLSGTPPVACLTTVLGANEQAEGTAPASPEPPLLSSSFLSLWVDEVEWVRWVTRMLPTLTAGGWPAFSWPSGLSGCCCEFGMAINMQLVARSDLGNPL